MKYCEKCIAKNGNFHTVKSFSRDRYITVRDRNLIFFFNRKVEKISVRMVYK